MKDRETLKWIYSGAKRQVPTVFLLLVLRCASSVMGVVLALTSKRVVDCAVAHQKEELISAAIELFLIIAFQIAVRFIGQNIEVRATARLQILFKTRLFGAILKKDYMRATAYHSGDLLTRLSNDVNIITNGIITLIPGVSALIAGLVYALYTLVRLDRNFAFIFLFGGIIVLTVIAAFRGVMKRLHKNVQETEGRLRSFFQEALGSLLMVKVFGIEDIIAGKATALQNENYNAQMKRKNLSIFASGSISLVFNLGSLYALVWSAFRLYSKTIGVGTLTAILQLVNQIQAPFAGLSGVAMQYYSIIASSERIIEIENLPNEKENPVKIEAKKEYENLSAIHFDNITFGYGDEDVLSGASLTVDKGDFAVIAGISGIGKSTLIKLLLGVMEPKAGSIYLETVDGGRLECGKYLRPMFSYVPQGNLLLSGTIREAVSLIRPDATDEEIMEAANVSCAAEFINKLPDGLNTHIGEKGLGLSEGQIQRLAVCRAILSDAPIILLDEATSALDEGTEERLLNNIKKMNNKTCIIISHKRAAFDICNKKIFIENRKIRVEE